MALLSIMLRVLWVLWVQGVIEPGSGQEVLMTIWISGGIKGTAQLAAAKLVCPALPSVMISPAMKQASKGP